MTDLEEKTEFKFSELSDSAKDKARDAYRGGDYPGYDWWNGVYEDAVRMGALIGIEISTTERKTTRGRTYQDTNIWFSGFSSQGDGASFEGDYQHVPDAVAKVTSETNDEELLRIAQELALLQLTRRLQGFEPFSATIKTSGHGCHSNTVDADLHVNDEDEDYDKTEQVQKDVTQLMRDFADWIYKNLETEYDYLTSDEYVDERLAESDDLFDEEGNEV